MTPRNHARTHRTVAATAALLLAFGGAGLACEDPRTPQSETAPSKEDDAEEPDTSTTEMKVGDTYRYSDDVEVTVTSLSPLTDLTDTDVGPAADETGFRVNVRIVNNSGKALDLEEFVMLPSGASTGGQSTVLATGADKPLSGRLADKRTGTYHQPYALAKEDGTSVVVLLERSDEEHILDEPPRWTGDIK